MDINLNITHPDYEATATARATGRDFYEGSDAVKASGRSYLYQETNESADEYELRLKRAVWEPHVSRIITARQGLLFRKPAERVIPRSLEPWMTDVDMRGTDAGTFFQRVALDAQVDGVRWVGVDMPMAPEAGFRSVLEERLANHRPFMESIPADAVIDWEVGADLDLDWAVVRVNHVAPRPMAGLDPELMPRWKIWYRDHWELYEESEGGGSWILVADGGHECGMVPLVPFLGVHHTDWSGWPICRPIFDHLLAIYNKTSNLDHFERMTAHPTPVIASPSKPEKVDSRKGLWLETTPGGGSVQWGLIEPSGSGLGSLRESVLELRGQIPLAMLAQAERQTSQVMSADSRREDRRVFSADLARTAQEYEAAERWAWRLLAAWWGESGDQIKIRYNTDFDDTIMDPQMIAAFGGLIDTGVLTRKTVLKALVDGEIITVDDVDAELQAAKAEASTRVQPQGVTADLIQDAGDD